MDNNLQLKAIIDDYVLQATTRIDAGVNLTRNELQDVLKETLYNILTSDELKQILK